MTIELIFFFCCAAVAVISAVMMITRPNPVKSVLFLIVNFFCLSLFYLLLHAQFIAVAQIIVYAGAIMVLFLFVIMLLNISDENAFREMKSFKRLLAIVLAGGVAGEIIASIVVVEGTGAPAVGSAMTSLGTVEGIGHELFTVYLLPFEVTSLLLLAAMVGVIILAKKKFQ
jgi:NADH-quinone oxidoreductase subunit J